MNTSVGGLHGIVVDHNELVPGRPIAENEHIVIDAVGGCEIKQGKLINPGKVVTLAQQGENL